MNKTRRIFNKNAIVLAATPFFLDVSYAQELIKGKDYTEIQPAVPTVMKDKVEVLELFGYWCPHCANLEGQLESFIKNLPNYVNFRRVPVGWQPSHIPLQKLFFALEMMGFKDEIHKKVFKAVQEKKMTLENDNQIAAFADAIGVDKIKLLETFKSFSVNSKVGMANNQVKSYQIEGVPAFVIQGQYLTSPAMAKGEVKFFKIINNLIQKAKG